MAGRGGGEEYGREVHRCVDSQRAGRVSGLHVYSTNIYMTVIRAVQYILPLCFTVHTELCTPNSTRRDCRRHRHQQCTREVEWTQKLPRQAHIAETVRGSSTGGPAPKKEIMHCALGSYESIVAYMLRSVRCRGRSKSRKRCPSLTLGIPLYLIYIHTYLHS